MDKRPDKDNCLHCGREVTKDNDFTYVKCAVDGVDSSFWYPRCRWCRGHETRMRKRIEVRKANT
jgi:hypothetical protein